MFVAVIGALDALITLDAFARHLLYVFGLAPSYATLVASRTRASHGRGPMSSERIKELRREQENSRTREKGK